MKRATVTAGDAALLRLVEVGYRRGFEQGATLALQQVDEGHPPARLERWLRDVAAWRSALRFTATPVDAAGWRCPPELPPKGSKR